MATYHKDTDSQIISKRICEKQKKTEEKSNNHPQGEKKHNPELFKYIICDTQFYKKNTTVY